MRLFELSNERQQLFYMGFTKSIRLTGHIAPQLQRLYRTRHDDRICFSSSNQIVQPTTALFSQDEKSSKAYQLYEYPRCLPSRYSEKFARKEDCLVQVEKKL